MMVDLAKSRVAMFELSYCFRKFDERLGGTAADGPARFRSDPINKHEAIAASRLRDI